MRYRGAGGRSAAKAVRHGACPVSRTSWTPRPPRSARTVRRTSRCGAPRSLMPMIVPLASRTTARVTSPPGRHRGREEAHVARPVARVRRAIGRGHGDVVAAVEAQRHPRRVAAQHACHGAAAPQQARTVGVDRRRRADPRREPAEADAQPLALVRREQRLATGRGDGDRAGRRRDGDERRRRSRRRPGPRPRTAGRPAASRPSCGRRPGPRRPPPRRRARPRHAAAAMRPRAARRTAAGRSPAGSMSCAPLPRVSRTPATSAASSAPAMSRSPHSLSNVKPFAACQSQKPVPP